MFHDFCQHHCIRSPLGKVTSYLHCLVQSMFLNSCNTALQHSTPAYHSPETLLLWCHILLVHHISAYSCSVSLVGSPLFTQRRYPSSPSIAHYSHLHHDLDHCNRCTYHKMLMIPKPVSTSNPCPQCQTHIVNFCWLLSLSCIKPNMSQTELIVSSPSPFYSIFSHF